MCRRISLHLDVVLSVVNKWCAAVVPWVNFYCVKLHIDIMDLKCNISLQALLLIESGMWYMKLDHIVGNAGLWFLKWHLCVCTLDWNMSASLPEADIITAHFRGVTAFKKIKVFYDHRKNFRSFLWIQDKAMPLNPFNFSTKCSSSYIYIRWLGASTSSALLYPL